MAALGWPQTTSTSTVLVQSASTTTAISITVSVVPTTTQTFLGVNSLTVSSTTTLPSPTLTAIRTYVLSVATGGESMYLQGNGTGKTLSTAYWRDWLLNDIRNNDDFESLRRRSRAAQRPSRSLRE